MAINATSGTLANGTPVLIPIAYTEPADDIKTLYLNSAAAGRLLQISVDGGTTFFTPPYDQVSATQLIVSISSRISHMQVTGVANDTWGIL